MIKKYYYNRKKEEPVKLYTVTLTTVYDGEATFTGAGTYNEGDNVTITCTPASGLEFYKWSDGNTSATRTITNIKKDYALTAYVRTTQTYNTIIGNALRGEVVTATLTALSSYNRTSNYTFGYVVDQMAGASDKDIFIVDSISTFNYNHNIQIKLSDNTNYYLEIINSNDHGVYSDYTFDGEKYILKSYSASDVSGYPTNIQLIRYPVCNIKKYLTVTFDSNGGTAVSSRKVKSGETIVLPNTSKEGYVFTGWSDGTTIYLYGSSVTINSDTTFTAQWRESTVNIIENPTCPDFTIQINYNEGEAYPLTIDNLVNIRIGTSLGSTAQIYFDSTSSTLIHNSYPEYSYDYLGNIEFSSSSRISNWTIPYSVYEIIGDVYIEFIFLYNGETRSCGLSFATFEEMRTFLSEQLDADCTITLGTINSNFVLGFNPCSLGFTSGVIEENCIDVLYFRNNTNVQEFFGNVLINEINDYQVLLDAPLNNSLPGSYQWEEFTSTTQATYFALIIPSFEGNELKLDVYLIFQLFDDENLLIFDQVKHTVNNRSYSEIFNWLDDNYPNTEYTIHLGLRPYTEINNWNTGGLLFYRELQYGDESNCFNSSVLMTASYVNDTCYYPQTEPETTDEPIL